MFSRSATPRTVAVANLGLDGSLDFWSRCPRRHCMGFVQLKDVAVLDKGATERQQPLLPSKVVDTFFAYGGVLASAAASTVPVLGRSQARWSVEIKSASVERINIVPQSSEKQSTLLRNKRKFGSERS